MESAAVGMWNARPHPGPLPQERESHSHDSVFAKAHPAGTGLRHFERRETIPPLPGGEGRGEGERSTIFAASPVSPAAGPLKRAEARAPFALRLRGLPGARDLFRFTVRCFAPVTGLRLARIFRAFWPERRLAAGFAGWPGGAVHPLGRVGGSCHLRPQSRSQTGAPSAQFVAASPVAPASSAAGPLKRAEARAPFALRSRRRALIPALLLAWLALCLIQPAHGQSSLTNGLVAYYPFDGNANDASGNGNNGIVYGAIPDFDRYGFPNGSFKFTGTTNRIRLNIGPSTFVGDYAISTWVNVTDLQAGSLGLVSGDQGCVRFYVLGAGYGADSGKVGFYMFRPDPWTQVGLMTSGSYLSTNRWHHLAVVRSGGNFLMYVDGALSTQTTGGSLPLSGTYLEVGNDLANASFLHGNLDDLRIYNRALSTNEIQYMVSQLVITNQPQDALTLAGGMATFVVGAHGPPPLSYQWRFNSINPLAGQTNSTLTISNVQPANVGLYSVVVSNSTSSVASSNAFLTIVTPGIDDDGDGLNNADEIQFGTNPLNPDTDDDDLTDYQEIFVAGTEPLMMDTDGDGMLDGWELQHGLNPRFNDAADDLDGDGLSNLAEYNWSLSHPNQLLDPRTKYSTSATVSDFAVVTGTGTNQFFYDRNNRLIGAEFDRGLALAYVYDGNDNLVRQVSMKHDANTNGLPDVWEFLNGLTNNASAYADTDGDGWTDYQEWKAGASPNATNSAPNLLGDPGINVASLTLPFTPSNFVVGVGQLDGLGAEEIVIGADGNPGTNVNWLLVLTQTSFGWSTQRVDVGSFGITSITVGQPTNRPSAGIYAGLRGTTNGSGRVIEFTSSGGLWQSNLVALSTNQAAFVLGVRGGNDLLASYAPTNGVEGGLHSLAFLTNIWTSSPLGTNTSHRGLGTIGDFASTARLPLRLLDSGGIDYGAIQYIGGAVSADSLVAYYPFDGNANNVSSAGNHGQPFGVVSTTNRFGRPNSAYHFFHSTNDYVVVNPFTNFPTHEFTVSFWKRSSENTNRSCSFLYYGEPGNEVWLFDDMNLRLRVLAPDEAVSQLVVSDDAWHNIAVTWRSSGGQCQFFVDGVMRQSLNVANGLAIPPTGPLVFGQRDSYIGYVFVGLLDDILIYNRVLTGAEIVSLFNAPDVLVFSIPEPPATRTNNWRGFSLADGRIRGTTTNGSSIFYTFADDKNANGLIDFADDFVTAEYLVSGTNASLLTLSRRPLAALTPAQSYGLASVNFLNASNEVFFTGEPDGQVFAWTATGTTNPLQRQLFTAQHAGKAWHALSGVKTLEAGEGLIGLRVDPTNQSRCDLIFWSPQSQLPQLANLPNTAPAAAVLPATNTLGSLALVTNRLWDAEGNASTPFLQYQLFGATNWQSATLVNASTPLAASPGGVNHTVVWNVQTDLGANVVTNILLRARASDFTLLGDWSAGTPFQVNTVTGPDADGDGLPDWWESQYFGNTSANPNDDPDGDGFSTMQEYLADTKPNDGTSYLHFTGLSVLPGGIKLNWLGGEQATQYMQRSFTLTATNQWLNIFTAAPPTPLSGSYTDLLGTNAMRFYRIEATRP